MNDASAHIGGSAPQGELLADPTSLTASFPTGAIGPSGDIPVAYAVFRVDIDEQAGVATDSRYIHVNREYSRATGRSIEALIGRSHLEIGEIDEAEWLSRCYRVVALGESFNGFEYNPLVRDWVSYRFAPSAEEGCCIFAFINAALDDEQRMQLLSSADARTSHFVSEMLSALSAEQSYEAAMNGMLAMMSQFVHTDRLSIFECGGLDTRITFERCADGVPSQLGTVFPLPKEGLQHWFRNFAKDPVVLVPDTSILERFSPPLYQWCQQSGVRSLMAAPFFIDGEIVGFLGAYNYQIDETVDLNRLFAAVSTFIAARIENSRLIDSLEWAGDHDALTNLLNRRGSQQAIADLVASQPDGPLVLVVFDIDDFKRTNDVYGHNAGDEALRALTRVLVEAFPADAILARNGGDEFLAMLSGDAARNAESLIAEFSGKGLSFEFEGESHEMATSIGYACFPEQATTVRDLFSRADAALYSVKLAGKAGYAKYTAEAEAPYRSQLGFSARDVIDNFPYAISIHLASEEPAILFASTVFAHMLGYDAMYDLMRDAKGALPGVVHPDDCAQVRQMLIDALNGDGRAEFDCRMLAKGGAVVSVHAVSRLVEMAEVDKAFYTIYAVNA